MLMVWTRNRDLCMLAHLCSLYNLNQPGLFQATGMMNLATLEADCNFSLKLQSSDIFLVVSWTISDDVDIVKHNMVVSMH